MNDLPDYHVITLTYGGKSDALRNLTLVQAEALAEKLWEANRAKIPCLKSELYQEIMILGPEGVVP